MSTEIRLPQLGFSMSEGTLNEWLVSDGDTVSEGQIIYTLEAEKATQEIEAPAGGIISLHAEGGQEYPVGTLLATIA
jgi:pyruvate/2-oxoglutarate dehydrogenase complex dihydrolipoamide acyltransferase (E2) component